LAIERLLDRLDLVLKLIEQVEWERDAVGAVYPFGRGKRLRRSSLALAKFWRRLTPAPSAASPVVIAALMSLNGKPSRALFSRSSLLSSFAAATGLNFQVSPSGKAGVWQTIDGLGLVAEACGALFPVRIVDVLRATFQDFDFPRRFERRNDGFQQGGRLKV
jgi:hypothetical protein